jgi:CubicO group peptidase (beta-lactamase class C family)
MLNVPASGGRHSGRFASTVQARLIRAAKGAIEKGFRIMMKFKVSSLLALLVLLIGMVANAQTAALAARPSQQESPLRLSEPVEAIVADLESYIPEYMREQDIPGVAIALIRDGEVIWADGFGVANTITGEPVTADTVFEVASNSKVVTVYTALRLVEQGLLSLDEPVETYLLESWLPPSGYREQITLRHLASHSSGLTNNLIPLDKSIIFKPGSDFLYSGVGALYIQEVIEQVTGQPLDEVANAIVFEPLGMTSSGFVTSVEKMPRMANGHMDYKIPVLVFAIPFVFIFIALGLIGLLILRFRSGIWRPTRKMVVGTSLVAGFLTLLVFVLLLGKDLPNLVLLIATVGVVFALVLAVMGLIGRSLFTRLPDTLQGGKTQGLLRITWVGLSLFVLLWLVGMITGPLPSALSPQPSAVGSLRTSATDLATFLIEVAEPQHLNAELAAQLRASQVSAGRDMTWGLGPGIQHSEHGNALWQNGQTFGFRSLMVVYPEQHIGVVVLTNSEHGFPLTCDVAQRALGGSVIPAIVTWLE